MPDYVTAKRPRDWGMEGRRWEDRRWEKRSKLEKIKWKRGAERDLRGRRASGRDGESGRGREAGWWEVYKKEREDDVEGVWSGPLSFQLMPVASTTANRQLLKGAQIRSLTKVLIRCGMAWKMLTCRQNVEVNWEADWSPYSNCQAEATCVRKYFVISLFIFPGCSRSFFFFFVFAGFIHF